jgi:iron complex transport system ATP-binding protein
MIDEPIVEVVDLRIVRSGVEVLTGLTWVVGPGERWVVLGPNGSGKSSLLQLVGGYLPASHGTVTVLGERIGRTDVRELRKRVGVAGHALVDRFRAGVLVEDVVVTARDAALEAWWATYSADDRARARHSLGRVGCADLAHRAFGTLSSGERQRVLIARALFNEPSLLLLDEPSAGLDFPGREMVLDSLAALGDDEAVAAMVLTTHHLEEIPRGFTHGLLLARDGVVTQGPLATALTSESISHCFGMALRIEHVGGRPTAVRA